MVQPFVKFGFVRKLHILRSVQNRALLNELRKNIIYRHFNHSVHMHTQARHERIGSVTFAYGGRIDSSPCLGQNLKHNYAIPQLCK
jgi:hypothetical protein